MIGVIERWSPFTLAVVTAVLLIWWRQAIVGSEIRGDVSFVDLYSAVLDWSAIQTGFLFGIFGYVAGKTDGFVAAIRHTDSLAQFNSYMRTAMALGFGVTITSIPLMVISHKVSGGGWWHYPIFSGWAFMSVWSFFCFGRVAYIFGILVRAKEKERIPG